ncbi:MAG TPA: hypothetical protein VGD40_26395 [Chryseosolibacter sp.]
MTKVLVGHDGDHDLYSENLEPLEVNKKVMSKRTVIRKPAKKAAARSAAKQKPDGKEGDTGYSLTQQIYIISERWQSDLVFFYDELNFLRKLIDKYFIWLIDDDNIESTRKVASELSKLEKRRFSILQRLDKHRRHLANVIENPFTHNTQECSDEHSELEVLFAGLAKEFRLVKKDVFDLTEHVIESEKAKRLLSED